MGNLQIGDNVVWYDHAGSLATTFCLHFLRASLAAGKPVVYVSFDRSPRNLLDQIGGLVDNPAVTILDCFTNGKGGGSEVFLEFYGKALSGWSCQVLMVEDPSQTALVSEKLYTVHESLSGDVRFVFESITGMQELWGSEESVVRFYSHSCPRLYELNTVAYWIIERDAHSQRCRAQINQIAQVVIDLSIKRGKTSLAIIKAEQRSLDHIRTPHEYWTKDGSVSIETQEGTERGVHLGRRLREWRTKRGFSQTELARLVGVTPSTISQIESNLIYPSLPAFLKMTEVLSVDASVLLRGEGPAEKGPVFPASAATLVRLPKAPETGFEAWAPAEGSDKSKGEPFLIDLAPNLKIPEHFFSHKGPEIGCVITGEVVCTLQGKAHILRAGDTIYLTADIPEQWHNPGPHPARLFWVKINVSG